MKKLLIIFCIACMVGVWGCATEQCQRRTYWTDLAQWLQLDEDAQRRWARYKEDDYWAKLFNVDDHSLGYWSNCQ